MRPQSERARRTLNMQQMSVVLGRTIGGAAGAGGSKVRTIVPYAGLIAFFLIKLWLQGSFG
jgi:hypothetical protein